MIFLKKYAMILVALIVASVTLMSFGLKSSIQQSLEWHERLSNGTYQLIPGPPSAEPSIGCSDETEVICAKGFAPNTAPSKITDETEAVDRFRPETVK